MTEPDPWPKLLTPNEVARIFGVTTKTVREWRRAGKIHGIRLPGGRYQYPETEIRAHLNKRPTDA